jgi:hypothetical protein
MALAAQKNTSKKILQNILKSKTNRYASYSEHFDEVSSPEGRRHGREGDQKAQNDYDRICKLPKQ